MKKGWEVKKLGDVCKLVRGPFGGSLRKDIFVKNGFAVYEQQHAIYDQFNEIRYFIDEKKFNEMRRFELASRDIIMSCSGTMGKVAIVPDKIKRGIINQALLKLSTSKETYPEFLKYWMGSKQFQESLNESSGGAAIKNVASVKILKEIKILLPPFPEQKRIVAILDDAFARIATAKANTEKNLQNARALFESYLNEVFSQRGEGWNNKNLGDKNFLEIIDGDRGSNYPKLSDFHEEGYCLFLNTKNVRADGFKFENLMFITAEKDKKLRKGKLKRNDIVLTTRGTIGNLGLYSEDIPYENVRINSGMLIFRPNIEVVLPEFLFELLRSGIMKEQISKNTTGAAQPQLPIKILTNFILPIPVDINHQRLIVENVKILYTQTQHLESLYQRKLAALDELKQSLLHQAFNGEL